MKRRDVLRAGIAALAMPAVARAAGPTTLRFVPQADLAVLDPIATPAFVTHNHGYMVFDTLYGVDDAFVAHPQMAEGHTVEDDGKTWRITLRDGLRFHDGEPVRARDVVASLNRWGRRDTYGTDLVAATDELSAPSDRVVQFRLKKPFPTLPDLLGKAGTNMPCIMPERLAGTDPMKPLAEMVGSGPFRFVAAERVPGDRVVYEKFAGYVPRPQGQVDFLSGPKIANVDRVEWHVIPDPSTAAAALQSGEVDWWEQPTTDVLPLLRRNPELSVEVQDKSGFLGVLRLNHLQPPFDNPAIRRALFPAIDQADFMTAVAGTDRSMWRDGIGFITPGPMASDAGMTALTGPRSRDAARQALKDGGYKGEKVVLMTPTDFASINAMSLVAEDCLRGIGMNVEMQSTDWGTVVQRFNNKGPLDKGGWSALCVYTTGAVTNNPADHRLLRAQGEKGGVYGWPSSPRIEALRTAYLDADSTDARKTICRDLQLQAFQDVPFIPLGIFYQPTAARKSVTGILQGFPLFYNLRLG
ncbi:MAG: ABC transporter substrate-binding protein [Acidisphaera sp.]|nr:ABC transporter substrate-binding protein [Acidisphaera sp.]